MFAHSFFTQIKKLKNKTSSQRGFTVIELIVIISIFAVMASVSLYNFQGFDDSTNINNLALDIALEIKRAQTLGSSSIDSAIGDKSAMSVMFTPSVGGTFQPRITVAREFPVNSGLVGDLGNVSGSDVIDRASDIFGGTIEQICLTDGGVGSSCDPVNDDIAVSFRRPYTEPIITSPACDIAIQDIRSNVYYESVCSGKTMEIHLTSGEGRARTIIVEPTGNIYTRNN